MLLPSSAGASYREVLILVVSKIITVSFADKMPLLRAVAGELTIETSSASSCKNRINAIITIIVSIRVSFRNQHNSASTVHGISSIDLSCMYRNSWHHQQQKHQHNCRHRLPVSLSPPLTSCNPTTQRVMSVVITSAGQTVVISAYHYYIPPAKQRARVRGGTRVSVLVVEAIEGYLQA